MQAQVQDPSWSAPFQLSSGENRVGGSDIVTDVYGFAHVFWVETRQDSYSSMIFYALYNGQTWFDPVDIFISEQVGQIQRVSAAVDKTGVIHLVWTAGGDFRHNPIYYSSANTNEALSSQKWQPPAQLDENAHFIRLLVDSNGALLVVYSVFEDPRQGVFFIRSDDQGETWTNPYWIDPDIPQNQVPFSLQVSLDDSDRIHVVWQYTARDSTIVTWVRYAHSLANGNTFSKPLTITKDVEGSNRISSAYPIIIAQGENVHLLWAEGDLNYRNHQVSTDGGESWSRGYRIQSFGDLNGQAFDGLYVDGIGQVHFLGQLRYPQGIYHSIWDQNLWFSPSLIYLIAQDPFVPIGDRIHAHHLKPIIRLGNHIILLFSDSPSDPNRQLYVMDSVLNDIPSITAVPVPTLAPVDIVTMTPPLDESSTDVTPIVDLAIVSTPGKTGTTASALYFSVLPVLLIIGLVILVNRKKK
jgi:hypothetical protein